MKLIKYRIVKDSYAGFEAQVWRWYFPFWEQIGGCNTRPSIEKAKELIKEGLKPIVWESSKDKSF